MRRTLTIVEMTLRDLSRRRGVFGLLFALPLVFYLARRSDANGQAIRFVLLGLGFTVSTAALFVTGAARGMDRRLRLSGYRVIDLHGGRLIAVVAVGLVVAAPYLAIIAFDQRVERISAIGLALALVVIVGAPVGATLSALVPRDLEGTLLLFAVLGAQFIMDPARPAAKFLPFWSAREIGTYAIDLADGGYLRRGVCHAAAYSAACFGIVMVTAAVRLRRRRPLRPRPPAGSPAWERMPAGRA